MRPRVYCSGGGQAAPLIRRPLDAAGHRPYQPEIELALFRPVILDEVAREASAVTLHGIRC